MCIHSVHAFISLLFTHTTPTSNDARRTASCEPPRGDSAPASRRGNSGTPSVDGRVYIWVMYEVRVYVSVCLSHLGLRWFYYTEFDTIVRPHQARSTLPRVHDETRKIHDDGRRHIAFLRGTVCMSHGMTYQSQPDRYSFKYTMRTYTVSYTTRHPEHGGLSFFRGVKGTPRTENTPIHWIYTILHYEHAVRIEDVCKSILRV